MCAPKKKELRKEKSPCDPEFLKGRIGRRKDPKPGFLNQEALIWLVGRKGMGRSFKILEKENLCL